MRRSRQSNGPRAPRGFTLIELIFVLALLAICAAFIAASLGGFFRGRAVSFEARRMLSLAHYGQSRAIAEGVPVVLWVNPKTSTYGLAVQSSFNTPDDDPHPVTYTAESSLTLEAPVAADADTSEQDDEKLGLPEDLVAIRFNPDGFIDESSVHKITVRQGDGPALDVVETETRRGYEIRPASAVN